MDFYLSFDVCFRADLVQAFFFSNRSYFIYCLFAVPVPVGPDP
jgi:hypothetical protein